MGLKRVGLLSAAAAATVLGIFALPWFVPVRVAAVDSVSQAVGFSNRAAVFCAILGAIGLTAVSYATRSAVDEPFVWLERRDRSSRLGWPTVALACAVSAAGILVVGVALNGQPALDNIVFVNRMLLVVNGSVPYAQFEFSYGPLMLYPQTWLFLLLHGVGVGVGWTSYIWLAAVQAVGVLLAAYVIDALAIPSRLTKGLLLFSLVVVDLPLVALNVSLFRAVLPYALLLFVLALIRRRGFGAAAAAAGVGAVIVSGLFSPELGVALFVGLVVATSLPAWRGVPGARGVVAALIVGGAIAGAIGSRLPMFAWTAAGVNNLPVLPGTPQIALVIALIVSAIALGKQVNRADPDATSLLVGWTATGLILLSPALGRADGMHVFIFGVGFVLVATVLASRRRLAVPWIVVCALAFMLVTWSWSLSNLPTPARAARASLSAAKVHAEGASRTAPPSLSSLSRVVVVGGAEDVLQELAFKKAIVPTYGWHMYTSDEVRLTLSQASGADWLLIPTTQYKAYASVAPSPRGYAMMDERDTQTPAWSKQLYGIEFLLAARHPSLDGPGSLYPALFARFSVVGWTGGWTLMKRR